MWWGRDREYVLDHGSSFGPDRSRGDFEAREPRGQSGHLCIDVISCTPPRRRGLNVTWEERKKTLCMYRQNRDTAVGCPLTGRNGDVETA